MGGRNTASLSNVCNRARSHSGMGKQRSRLSRVIAAPESLHTIDVAERPCRFRGRGEDILTQIQQMALADQPRFDAGIGALGKQDRAHATLKCSVSTTPRGSAYRTSPA